MAVKGTEQALTLDSNVLKFYFMHTDGHPLPQGLGAGRMKDFCTCVVDEYPIAVNRFIKQEYESTHDPEHVSRWLSKRLQGELAIEVPPTRLSDRVKSRLREYGFDCSSADAKYIETCNNTIFKLLVTENTEHFFRRLRSRKRRSLPEYLGHELGLRVHRVDDCCAALLDV